MFDKIILIDDDEAVLYFNRYIIEQSELAVEVTEAMDYDSAIKLLEDLKYPTKSTSLILIDINMPLYNGFEFVEKHRTLFTLLKENGFKLVFHSTSCNPQDIKKINESDLIYSFLEKPLKIESLKEMYQTIKSGI
jgi:CheY-like chemotaxis protein